MPRISNFTKPSLQFLAYKPTEHSAMLEPQNMPIGDFVLLNCKVFCRDRSAVKKLLGQINISVNIGISWPNISQFVCLKICRSSKTASDWLWRIKIAKHSVGSFDREIVLKDDCGLRMHGVSCCCCFRKKYKIKLPVGFASQTPSLYLFNLMQSLVRSFELSKSDRVNPNFFIL